MLKRFEDPPPSPSIRLGAQGLGIGLACNLREEGLTCLCVLCSSASAGGKGGFPIQIGGGFLYNTYPFVSCMYPACILKDTGQGGNRSRLAHRGLHRGTSLGWSILEHMFT